ncbi:MAG: hypothetical protein IPK80_02220 [Nannocystis sp.]|nr:hypothetical protein [Nannocystis sp.]
MAQAIKGVEIFSAGTWNGDAYTVEDLNEMVRAFTENSVGARPHLKIGHDPKQKVAKELMQSDGMPALGWIEKLYVQGEKLVADFSDVPDKLFSLVQKKAYRKVSSEIFHNIKIGEKKYKKMLAAVALLGADMPGVMNLKDIMSSYSGTFGVGDGYDKLSVYEIDFISESKENQKQGDKMEKTALEIRLELEKELVEKENAELKEFKAQAEKVKADADKELADLKEFKAKAEKEKVELLAQAEEARVEAFATSLVTDKLATPAMKPLVVAILGAEKKEYSVKLADKEIKISKEDLLKETLKLFKAASEVNFEESSSFAMDGAKGKEDEMDKKAKAYMAENKCSYGQALKAVMGKKD